MRSATVGSLNVNLALNTAQFNQQIAQVPAVAQQAATRVSQAFAGAGTSLVQFQRNTNATRFAVQNLSFQLNDIATSLASGGSLFRVLAQQSGQIVQVFQQGGGIKNVLGGAATAIRGMITPATLAAAGIGAVAVGIGVLTARALESTGAMRQFSVMLKGFSVEGQATAAGLEAAAKRLRDVGLTAADARTALRGAVRAGISPGAAERVVRTGQNLTPVLGDDAPQQLVGAISGGVDSLGKLALQLGVVTEREVAAAREASRFGQEIQYLDRWVRLIEQHSEGLNKEALSPMAQAMREVRINIAEMLDAASRSDLIMGIVNGMNALAKALKAVFDLRPPAWFNKLMGVGTAPGAQGPTGRVLGSGKIPGATGGGGAGAAAGGGRLSVAEMTAIAEGAGFSGDAARTMAAIAMAESSGDPNAIGDKSLGGSYGITQIHGPAHGQDRARGALGDPNRAMELAYQISRGGTDFRPWTMYKNGQYRQYLGGGSASGGGSVLARPGASGDRFTADQETAFRLLSQETAGDIAGLRDVNAGFSFGGMAGGRVAELRSQAASETSRRFGFGQSGMTNEQITLRRTQQMAREKQLIEQMQAQAERNFAERSAEDQEHSEQLRLQASLAGKSTEQIDRQVELLKVRQQAEAAGLSLTGEAVEAREREVNALRDSMDHLARQRALMDQIREVGGVFENTFSRAFDSITEGTFRLREALGGLLKDLGKTLASQAFRAILHGDTGSGGGLLGSIFGLLGGGGGINGGQVDFGGGGDLIPAFAGGGSFMVGGGGGIDSQLVQFWASPDERVTVEPPGGGHGASEVVRVQLETNDAFMAGIADRQITTRSGTIVQVAVSQSTKAVQRNWSGMSSEASQRQL